MRLVEGIKSEFRYNKNEIIGIIVASIVLGFIISFRDWGTPLPRVSIGLINFINSSLVVFVSLVIVTSIQKITGIRRRHIVDYKVWPIGLVVSVLFAVISNGAWWILLPGGLIFSGSNILGIGDKLKGNIMHQSRAIVAFAGPLTHLAIAYIFYYLSGIGLDNYLVSKLVKLNLALAIITLIPIPQPETLINKFQGMKKEIKLFQKPTALHGYYIIYHSRIMYAFALSFVIILSVLLFYVPFIAALILGLLIASTLALIWMFAKEF